MKKYLILGSNGMVGSSIVRALRSKNFDVLQPSRSELDLEIKSEVKKYLLEKKPDFIINAAGKVGGIKENISKDKELLLTNLSLGLNVIHCAYELGIKSYINFASSCIYTTRKKIHTEEDIDFNYFEPTNWGYAFAKSSILRVCQRINNEKDFNYKTIVPCNLFGINDNFDPESSHLIPAIIHKLHNAKINKEKKVEIWGDGSAKREFLYTEELSRFLIFYVENFDKMPEVLNIGTGKSITVLDYYKFVAGVVGYRGEFIFDKTKPNGIAKKELDLSKMKKLGWKIKMNLTESIEQTYNYYKKNYGK